jgi:hypothetical protein
MTKEPAGSLDETARALWLFPDILMVVLEAEYSNPSPNSYLPFYLRKVGN